MCYRSFIDYLIESVGNSLKLQIAGNKMYTISSKISKLKTIRSGYKADLTKHFDQICVWYRWKGYLPGSMENECWVVASGRIG